MLCYLLFIFALGPAESLFKESYYELMKTALKPDGLLCCQGNYLVFVSHFCVRAKNYYLQVR